MSRASTTLIASAALAVLACADASGGADKSEQDQDSSSASEKVQEVTVTAQRAQLAKSVTAFVGKITGPLFEGGLTRWGLPVCPLVLGVPQQQAEWILARVSDIARAGGIPLAGDKCSPNLYIWVTAQPQELLKGMAERRFDFTFGYTLDPPTSPFSWPPALPTKSAPPPPGHS